MNARMEELIRIVNAEPQWLADMAKDVHRQVQRAKLAAKGYRMEKGRRVPLKKPQDAQEGQQERP